MTNETPYDDPPKRIWRYLLRNSNKVHTMISMVLGGITRRQAQSELTDKFPGRGVEICE